MNPTKTPAKTPTMAIAPAAPRVLPATQATIEAIRESAEATAAVLAESTIENTADFEAVGEVMRESARDLDSLVALRQSITGPIKKEIAAVEAAFRPATKALEGAVDAAKRLIGGWSLAQECAAAEAYRAAAAAAAAGDGAAMLEAVAAAPAPPKAATTTTSLGWGVAAVDLAVISREYLIADVAKLSVFARAWKGEGPPVLAGVVFERIAKVGARR